MNGNEVRGERPARYFMHSAGAVFLVACIASTGVFAEENQTGEQHYERVCSDCHNKGATNNLAKGAPRLGDRRAWESRVKKGFDAIYGNIIGAKTHGKGDDAVWQKTNPFIWREELTDEQIRESLKYMFEMAD
jgi:cytochrome c5